MSTHEGHGTKAILAALVANFGISIAKFVGFLITGSSSLLAESGHSLADTTNQALLLLGGRQAKRAEDEDHEFGYGMTRYFWSFVVALILFSMGSLFALYEGFSKLNHPHEIEKPLVAIGILVVAIILETFSFKTAVAESRPLKGSQSWWSFIRHAKVPELPVLLLEDSGALLGLIIALGATLLTMATDNALFDAYGTIAIGVLLGVIAVILIIEMRSFLLGEAASPEAKKAIRTAIDHTPLVSRFIHSRTVHLGPDTLLVTAKVEFNEAMSFSAVAAAIDDIEANIRSACPQATLIYIEPALYDPSRT